MKYKVGDRVRIKSLDWFRNKGINIFNTCMMKHYGEVVTIKSVHKDFYRIKEDGWQYCWIDEMIECKVEEKSKPEPRFKAGDKVQIKNFDWYNENKNKFGKVWCNNGRIPFDTDMSKYCGKVMTISHDRADHYTMVEDLVHYWTDEMIERKVGQVEEDNQSMEKLKENAKHYWEVITGGSKPKFKAGDKITNGKVTLIILTLSSDRYIVEDNLGECGILYFNTQDGWKIVEEETKSHNNMCKQLIDEMNPNAEVNVKTKPIDLTVKGEEAKERIEIAIPEGYEYVIESDKIIFTKKKKEYPKTFEECVSVLMVKGGNRMSLEQMNTFRKLIDARNAYWAIYGEENGLGKPWEPDYKNEYQKKYCIYSNKGEITKGVLYCTNSILAFPTKEMMDEFYENFKKEIEICKELL